MLNLKTREPVAEMLTANLLIELSVEVGRDKSERADAIISELLARSDVYDLADKLRNELKAEIANKAVP